MPEVLVISGKGGTGKTSLTAAFAHVAENAVVCDLDVDAPDLHLLLQPEPFRVEEFRSGHLAVIDPARCKPCDVCRDVCQFGAVEHSRGEVRVDPMRCEGCKVCVALCPAGAIDFPERLCGQWYLSRTRFGPMAHAQLAPGRENSGRLVALLRQQARTLAAVEGADLILSDGPPGIGCPVISSLSGVDLAVVVTEPTPSGRHDLDRVLDLCAHFRVRAAVIVNKCDVNEELSDAVEADCLRRGVAVLARLPHDEAVTRAMVAGQAVTETVDGRLPDMLRSAWAAIVAEVGPGVRGGPTDDAPRPDDAPGDRAVQTVAPRAAVPSQPKTGDRA